MKKQLLIFSPIIILFGLLLFGAFSCGPTRVNRSLGEPAISTNIDPDSKYLKVHMRDGSLYVLKKWVFDQEKKVIWGEGSQYDQNRNLIAGPGQVPGSRSAIPSAMIQIPNADVVLLESSTLQNSSGNLASITIVGVPFGLISAYCIINPKACFGSCPTFYAFDGERMELMAEGFSSSILPVYEKKDIDMLYWQRNKGKDFQIKLTNEAMETHVIRYADLLVFPVRDGERVFATEDGEFFRTSTIHEPVKCVADEGNICDLIRFNDHNERFSETDTRNLAKREEIEMEFEVEQAGQYGLLLSTRQTLLTTWLFYQSLAYTGTMAGHYAAAIERGNKVMKRKVDKLWELLGGVEVLMMDERGKWMPVEELTEMGPIASDVHLIALPKLENHNVRIKLRMTQGLWRIDYLALAALDQQVYPERLRPARVWRENEEDEPVRQILLDTINPLVTYPGDQYRLTYTLPEGGDMEVFLESKGYYLEWIREEWLAEEDLKKAALMFALPGLYLRKAAPAFKEVEPLMEEKFWGSRYVKHE